MTERGAGMTERGAGMTERGAGMTEGESFLKNCIAIGRKMR